MTHIKDLRSQITLHNAQYIPQVVLLVAVGLGLYTHWSVAKDRVFSFISITAMFVFALACTLRYCGMQRFGGAMYHIWVGCLVGMLAYSDNQAVEFVTTLEVMEALFLTSLVLAAFWHILARLLKLTDTHPGLLGMAAGLEGFGFMISGLVSDRGAPALALVTLAFLTHVAALRLKSIPVVPSLVGLIVVAVVFIYPELNLQPNMYALACFAGHHALPATFDLYLLGRSLLERWQEVVFTLPRIVRYLSLLLMMTLNIALGFVVGYSTTHHKEWFVVFPLFLAVSLVWFLLHLAFLAACWQLMGKVIGTVLFF